MEDKLWVVALDSGEPMPEILDQFTEESDALAFAQTYADVRVSHQRSKRIWIIDTGDDTILLKVYQK